MSVAKKLILLAVVLVFAGGLLFSLAVMIKPGAGIFYLKIRLKPDSFQPDVGYAYRYKVNLPPALYPTDRTLLFEDGQQLARGTEQDVVAIGNGIFLIDESPEEGFYIFLAPSGNSDPATNGKSYRLYCASSLLTRSLGIVYFSTLLFGVFQLAGLAFKASQRSIPRSWQDVWQVVIAVQAELKSIAKHIDTQMRVSWRKRLVEGRKLILLTAAAAYALVFIEWVFQVTKVSFMDGMSLGQKVAIFLLSGLAVVVLAMAINAALILLELLLRPLRLAWLPACLNAAVPVLLLSGLAVLMLDSFTYTVFHFGMLTTQGVLRVGYGILVMFFFFWCYRGLLRLWGLIPNAQLTAKAHQWLRFSMLGLLGVSAVVAVFQIDTQAGITGQLVRRVTTGEAYPNIILIASDGLSAKNMSAYGYERETTPNITALAEGSLLAENAYTNTNTTYGSIISLLSSKMPLSNGVIYPPDILQDEASYEHLPGMLKDLGYTNVQIGVSKYVDANTWNIHNGFDIVNNRTAQTGGLVRALNQLGYDLPALMILTIEERLTDRLLQAFTLDSIQNPFTVVTTAASWEDDRRRMNDLLRTLEDTQEPIFAQVHLLATHGPYFSPDRRVYSVEQEQNEGWMIDFYDDAVLSFDAYIGELVNQLKNSGQFERTILVLFSDHAMAFQSNERTPLLIHFPGDQHQGQIQTNVQSLDIAPTIVDYLGIPIPEWMEGDSMLQFSDQIREPLFSLVLGKPPDPAVEVEGPSQDLRLVQTDHYRFSAIQVFYCQRMFQLDLKQRQWSSNDVAGHTAPCAESSLPDIAEISEALVQFLVSRGYDPSVVP